MSGNCFERLHNLVRSIVRNKPLGDFQSYHAEMQCRLTSESEERNDATSCLFRKLMHQTVFICASECGRSDILEFLQQPGNMTNEEKAQLPLNECLVVAINKRHTETALYLLETFQPDLNDFGQDEEPAQTPLLAAADSNDLQIARLLLEKGANPNLANKRQRTPLHAAATRGSLELLRLLVEYSADTNAVDVRNYTPLHFACREARQEATEFLLHKGASATTQTADGYTPLRMAYLRGTPEMVRMLLRFSADPWEGHTTYLAPLVVLAVQGNRLDLLQIMLEGRHEALNRQLEDGRTLLHVAAAFSRLEILKWLLLQTGLNPNARDWSGQSPVHSIVTAREERLGEPRNDVECLRCLAKAGADLSITDNENKIPLFYAASGAVGVLEAMIDLGASVNTRDPIGRTVLHFACEHQSTHDNVRLLLQKNACPESEDKGGKTPILYAVQAKSPIIFNELRSHGCDLFKADNRGTNILHCMCKLGLDIIDYMRKDHPVTEGVVDRTDKAGWTPLHFAAFYRRSGAVDWLLESNATIDCRTPDGQTPLHLVCRECPETVNPSLQDSDESEVVSSTSDSSFGLSFHSATDSDDDPDTDNGSQIDSVRETGKKFEDSSLVAPSESLVIVRVLIENGLDTTILDKYGNTAFFLAAMSQSMDSILFELIRAAASRGFFESSYQPSPKRQRLE